MSPFTSPGLALMCLEAIRRDEEHHGQRAEIVLDEETASTMPRTFPNRRSTIFVARRAFAERALPPLVETGDLTLLPMIETMPMVVFSATDVLAWCLTTGVRPALFRRVDHYKIELVWL